MLICLVLLAAAVCTHSAYSAQLNYTLVNEFTLFCHSVPRGENTTQVVLCLPQINTYFLNVPKSFDTPHIKQAGGVNIHRTWLWILVGNYFGATRSASAGSKVPLRLAFKVEMYSSQLALLVQSKPVQFYFIFYFSLWSIEFNLGNLWHANLHRWHQRHTAVTFEEIDGLRMWNKEILR